MHFSTIPTTACAPSAIDTLSIFGAEILSLSASPITNFSFDVFGAFNYNHGEISVTNASFCNITVTYIHPRQNDFITGRFALSPFFMAGAIGEGYAATTTDAGLAESPRTWALKGDENVDLYALQDLGSKFLYDQAVIGKSLVKSFYGRDPAYSYWSRCSQGGRQAVTSCDLMDGVVDGLISNMSLCNYDPFRAVSSTSNCSSTGQTMRLSNGAAMLADAIWSGARSTQGNFLWYGLNPGADISGFGNNGANTQGSGVQGLWIGQFLQKLQNYNNSVIDHEYINWLFRLGIQEYTDIIGTADSDLTEFQNAGGKLLSYHGMADNAILTKGTEHYYNAVNLKTVFDALRSWVENGTALDTLPIEFSGEDGSPQDRILCSYPSNAVYCNGNSSSAENFRCVD
ncbi:uncharacterized protein EURHEDRAFT_519193 [Aspergillus ruber CBS 135680]|uniref:Carboxylic ester hydrolase n=1 Tax=Aspergillus ruber (strain CBS 135680) TaxID=1388766 RepID=A0A017S1A6_ASPRC|nr:uncharacterized protein EURHEDRAFT_519193 [Aspergillus ruber CBS 135680]EYE90414.1 hypothetical protein EURHEDRAFT_519193 [Aspergillus ruber CBS 135680]